MSDARGWDDRQTRYWSCFHSDGDTAKLYLGEGSAMNGKLSRRPERSTHVVARPLSGVAPSSTGKANRHGNTPMRPSRQTSTRKPDGILWVDAVGGFLLFLNDALTIGQASPQADVDVPILGDVSRRHAVITRSGEDYWLDPLARVRVAGATVTSPVLLGDGDEIELGSRVALRFRQPSPLSNTARLDLMTHHRTLPSADGMILLGQTCLLGPTDDHHLVCRDLREPVLLMPTDDGRFRFKAGGTVRVDGEETCDTGIIEWGSHLSGEDFALKLERL